MNEKQLFLQPRLRCIADCVPRGARLADIGTDHGYLPVWLLLNGRIERAVASDINAAPLEHARRTAREYGVEARIDFRLCAGLDGFSARDADTIVIAGMGGETMISILRAAPWLVQSDTTLQLQPMTKAELLRPWLVENGFCIASERLVRDKGVIYTVMTVRAGRSAPLDAAEVWCGVGLRDDPLYARYALNRAEKLERAAAGLRCARTPESALIEAFEADAAALRKRVKEWENADCT